MHKGMVRNLFFCGGGEGIYVIFTYLFDGQVRYRPQIHCDHIGPTGGDMCTARDVSFTTHTCVQKKTN